MQIIFVITGLAFLVATIVQLVADMVKMFETTKFSFEVFSHSMLTYLPSAEAYIQNFITQNMAQGQWVGYIDWLMQQSTFAVLGCLGLFFILLSFLFRKRKFKKTDKEFI